MYFTDRNTTLFPILLLRHVDFLLCVSIKYLFVSVRSHLSGSFGRLIGVFPCAGEWTQCIRSDKQVSDKVYFTFKYMTL